MWLYLWCHVTLKQLLWAIWMFDVGCLILFFADAINKSWIYIIKAFDFNICPLLIRVYDVCMANTIYGNLKLPLCIETIEDFTFHLWVCVYVYTVVVVNGCYRQIIRNKNDSWESLSTVCSLLFLPFSPSLKIPLSTNITAAYQLILKFVHFKVYETDPYWWEVH